MGHNTLYHSVLYPTQNQLNATQICLIGRQLQFDNFNMLSKVTLGSWDRRCWDQHIQERSHQRPPCDFSGFEINLTVYRLYHAKLQMVQPLLPSVFLYQLVDLYCQFIDSMDSRIWNERANSLASLHLLSNLIILCVFNIYIYQIMQI